MKMIINILVFVFALNISAANDSLPPVNNQNIKAILKVPDASTAEKYFTDANKLYDKSDFQGALNIYLGILNSGYISHELFYNLGNIYFRLNNLPSALLYYEKAAKLNVNDEDTQYNIAFVNNLITDKIEKRPVLFIWEWLGAFRNMLTSTGWSVLIIIFSWLTFASLAVYLVIRYVLLRKVAFIASLGFFTITLISVYCANDKYALENSTYTAIVFTPRIDIRHSPEAEGKVFLTLHEGTKVSIEEEINGWYKIRLTDGRVGWIQEESLRII